MGDIGQRIFALRRGQRAARPIGKAAGFIKVFLGNLLDQRLIADLFAKAADHGGDLRVKQGIGKDIALDEKDFQILARRVKDLHRRLVAKEVIERLHRHLRPFDRIHQNRVAVFARQRHLDQAKLGPVGAFAQKLGVDGDIGMILGRSAKGGKVFGRGYGPHGRPFTARGAGASRHRPL